MFLQSKKDDCAKAVVRYTLAKMYRDKRLYFHPLEEDCKDFYHMRMELEKCGLFFESYAVNNIKELRKQRLPIIAQCQQEGMLHFVLVLKVSKHHYSVYDPMYGEMDLDNEEFLDVFTGKVMVLSKFEKTKLEKFKQPITKLETCFYYFLSFLCFSSLLPLFLFQEVAENFLLSMGCVLTSAIFVVLINSFNIYLRRKLEKRILFPCLSESLDARDFQGVSNMINTVIKHHSLMACYAAVIPLFFISLLANHVFYAFLLLISVAMELLKCLLQKEKNQTLWKCTMWERRFLKESTKGNLALTWFQKAKSAANHHLAIILTVNIAQFFLTLLLTFAVMSMDGIYSINFLFFTLGYTFSFSYLLRQFLSSFDYLGPLAKDYNALSESAQKKMR